MESYVMRSWIPPIGQLPFWHKGYSCLINKYLKFIWLRLPHVLFFLQVKHDQSRALQSTIRIIHSPQCTLTRLRMLCLFLFSILLLWWTSSWEVWLYTNVCKAVTCHYGQHKLEHSQTSHWESHFQGTNYRYSIQTSWNIKKYFCTVEL